VQQQIERALVREDRDVLRAIAHSDVLISLAVWPVFVPWNGG
jgi:hypothetical protein